MGPENNGEKIVDVAEELRRLQEIESPALGGESVGGVAVNGFSRERKSGKGLNTAISVFIDGIGETLSHTKRITIGSFARLRDDKKLLMAVGMARSTYYEGVFPDAETEDQFLLKIVNKGKPKPKGRARSGHIGEKGMRLIIDEEVEKGTLELNEDGRPTLTEEGLMAIHKSTKKAGFTAM